MFRSKRGASQGSEPASEPAAAVEAPPPPVEAVKPEVKRNIPFPAARPMPHAGFPLDISRRSSELAQLGGRAGEAERTAANRDKTLTIGRDVELRGEVPMCERLVVDGTAQLTLSGARLLQIGPSGLFTGSADVAEADIAGRFEGQLTVRERLTIRGSGQVRGRICYGQIVIEAGGEVSGDIGTVAMAAREVAGDAAATGNGLAPAAPFADVKFAAPAD